MNIKAFVVLTVLAAAAVMFSLLRPSQAKTSPQVHDFGFVTAGEKLSDEFVIPNTTGETWNIQQIQTTCGCTSARPEKTVIAPGESARIPVSVDVKDDDGAFENGIAVLINRDKLIKLSVKGTAMRELPRMLTLDSKRTKGTFYFRNLAGQTTKVLSAESTSPLVMVFHEAAGNDHRFDVELIGGTPGEYKSEVRIRTDSGSRVVPVSAFVVDYIVLDNQLYSVGVLGSEGKSFNFEIESTRGREIKIIESKTSSGAVVAFNLGRVTVKVAGNDSGQLIEETVWVKATDGDCTREFKVRIYGIGKKGVHAG